MAKRKMTKSGLGAVSGTHTPLSPAPPVTCPAPRTRHHSQTTPRAEWPAEAGSGSRRLGRDLTALDLTPREAWILSLVDGAVDLDAIADATGASRAEIIAAIEKLG